MQTSISKRFSLLMFSFGAGVLKIPNKKSFPDFTIHHFFIFIMSGFVFHCFAVGISLHEKNRL